MKRTSITVALLFAVALAAVFALPRGVTAVEGEEMVAPEEATLVEDALLEPVEPAGISEVEDIMEEDMMAEPMTQPVAEEDDMASGLEELPDPTGDLIELDTERSLAPGIDMVPGDEGQDLITITLDNVPLQDVVRMFTRISGANIVAGTNLTGAVTVSLQDVEWEPALRVILDSVEMALVEKTEGIYTVMSKRDLASEPVTVDTIFLNFTTVSNTQPVVSRMLVHTNASVSAFPSANALVVQETADRLNTIRQVISQIDRPRPQVYIEAKFVELTDEAITDLGIDWSPLGSDEAGLGYSVAARSLTREFTETRRKNEQDANGIVSGLSVLDTTDTTLFPNYSSQRDVLQADSISDIIVRGKNFTEIDATEGTLETIIPFEQTTMLSAMLSAEDFELTLSALKQTQGVDIISNPKVIVANEETATIHVGRNEPNVVAVPQGDTGDRFAYALDSRDPYIEIGVKLHVTPTVNTEENITIKLVPELSRLIGQKEVGEGATRITFPITEIRKVTTEFGLSSGNTVAIGGLTETTDEERIKKIPILGDIPIIGKYLFRHTHTLKRQDEVIVFVTVGLANPESLVEVSGIPSEGRLIHGHLATKAQESDL